jgi:hypothetical protein
MSTWNSDFIKGRRQLARGNTQLALGSFQKAVKACPVRNSRTLSSILFYTGLALRKLGLTHDAVRSWCAAWDLQPGGPAARHIKSNACCLESAADEAGWHTFFAIQLERYLRTKHSRSIGTLAEQDMIRELIADSYRALQASGRLNGLDREARLHEYRAVEIVFPLLVPIRPPDFLTKIVF